MADERLPGVPPILFALSKSTCFALGVMLFNEGIQQSHHLLLLASWQFRCGPE